ncbi:uncharacterized protein FFE2_05128 [Fusarium fujikuroi]|nr:uncharacterized protein FFE2_05128 [Fusarium fujikuroi]
MDLGYDESFVSVKGKTKPEKGISRHPYNPTRTEGYSRDVHICDMQVVAVNQATIDPEPGASIDQKWM